MIIIPSSVTAIGNNAFKSSYLQTVNIQLPSQLTIIPSECFSNCIYLNSINIPDSVTTIGESSFKECIQLTTVIFTRCSQLQTIESEAFSGCRRLININVPPNVTIRNYAFRNTPIATIFHGIRSTNNNGILVRNRQALTQLWTR